MNPLWPVLPYLVALVLVMAGVAALVWWDTKHADDADAIERRSEGLAALGRCTRTGSEHHLAPRPTSSRPEYRSAARRN